MKRYKVQSRYFDSMEAAKAYCNEYFRRNGIVLAIVESKSRKAQPCEK